MRDAYKHCKAILAWAEGIELLQAARVPIGPSGSSDPADAATVVAPKASRVAIDAFVTAMAGHRLWTRELEVHLPL